MKSLKEWRISRQLTRPELAAAASIRVGTLIDLEQGRRLPQYSSMRRICGVLGVAPQEIEEFAEALEERQSFPALLRYDNPSSSLPLFSLDESLFPPSEGGTDRA